MSIAVVIPTYWGREGHELRENDQPYDHPTPLDMPGTIRRAVESISSLKDKNFELVILACATSSDIVQEVEERVEQVLEDVNCGVNITLFKHSHFDEFREFLDSDDHKNILSLYGYSNIRNMCLAIPHLLGKSSVVLVDDDELFCNPNHLSLVRESLGKVVFGREVLGLSGFYTRNGEWKNERIYPWGKQFNRELAMNETLKSLIGDSIKPRLEPTFFVLGGNMAVSKKLFMEVPFDPKVVRGEDMDYAINARMFNKPFYFHNQFSIEHWPPIFTQPLWRLLRSDTERFIYEYKKLVLQEPVEGVHRILPEYMEPYPGSFLNDDCIDLFKQANLALKDYYQIYDDFSSIKNVNKTLESINKIDKDKSNHFLEYVEFQRKWKEMMGLFDKDKNIRKKFKKIVYS